VSHARTRRSPTRGPAGQPARRTRRSPARAVRGSTRGTSRSRARRPGRPRGGSSRRPRAATPAPRPWPAPPVPHPSRAPHTRHRAPRVLAVGVARDLRELRRCSGRLHTVAGPAETAGGTTASAIEGTYMVMGHTATAQAGSGGLTATEHRLANGLRVVLSEDHLTPVAAVCLWYDVGSRHEVKGRTGLAHLFEHLMFQGSAQVKGNGHLELVQGAGGSLNGTTSFERTNYFETMPAHQLELALWLEADRMGSLLAALDEESMENQRDVVKNERRQRYDNVPYGTAFEKLTALAYPEGHPYHHTPIGSMADLDAATLQDARQFFRTYYAPNNAVLSVVGDIPSHGGKPEPGDGSRPDGIGEDLREVVVEAVPARALMAAYRLPEHGTRACDAVDLALTVLGGGESSRIYNRLVRRDRTAV